MLKSIVLAVAMIYGASAMAQIPAKKDEPKKAEPKKAPPKKKELNTAPPPGKPIK